MFLTTLSCIYSGFSCFISFISLFFSIVHTVLPFGIDVGLLGVAAFYFTRLPKPEAPSVDSVFGPEPTSKQAEDDPSKVVKCIAHRGAALDAPENTLEAFKYCAKRECGFVELDVRSCADGSLVLLHDSGLQRLTGTDVSDVRALDWEAIRDADIAATHPNRHKFPKVRVCLLDEALDFLLEKDMRVIIDVKGDDAKVVTGVVGVFAARPQMYASAAVTCFNPFVLYKIRKLDPAIVCALSYRPYCFSALSYDAEHGAGTARFGDRALLQGAMRLLDVVHSMGWRTSARWLNVAAVLLHKDIVSPTEVAHWRSLGVRSIGWSVNRPLEKLYWRGVLKAPYLANTLVGEPPIEKSRSSEEKAAVVQKSDEDIEELLAQPERKMGSGQN